MKLYRLAGICALMLGSSSAFGGIVAWRSLAALSQNADAIVVGVASGGLRSGSVLDFNIHVLRVVKGDETLAGTDIAVGWTLPASSASLPAAGNSAATGTGLWFLQSSPAGWALLPVMTGDVLFNQAFIPGNLAPLPAVYSYAASTSLSDKVASEVSSAIESGTGSTAQLFGLYFGPLDQLNSPVTRALYGRLSASTRADQQILGLAGRLRQSDATALTAVAALGASLAKYPAESGVLSEGLRNEFRATDAQSVAALGQLASTAITPGTPLRVAVAHALAAIHTRDALPFLVAFLDDGDPNVRAEGVGGLGAFANGLPVQTSAANPSLAGC